MATEFMEVGDEVEAIVARIAEEYHPALIESGAKVVTIFRLGEWKSKGKVTLGTMQVVSGHTAFLAQAHLREGQDPNTPFYLMILNATAYSAMSDKAREALIDHELCHAVPTQDEKSGDWTLSCKGHDIEEFNCIVERHGLWKSDVQLFAQAVQAQLPGMGEAPVKRKATG